MQSVPMTKYPTPEECRCVKSSIRLAYQAFHAFPPTITNPVCSPTFFNIQPNCPILLPKTLTAFREIFYFPAIQPNLLRFMRAPTPTTMITDATTTAQSCICSTFVLNVVCVAAHTVASIRSRVM